MAELCGGSVPVTENPGALLGTVLGVLAQKGIDKATIIASPPLWDFGPWLEQLLAESTGKQEKGIIPVDGEQPGPPERYGADRFFIYLRLESEADRSQDDAVDSIEKAGHPVLRVNLADLYDVGGEFFRWEFATAVAGSILGINPFDQPDVEASKHATRKLTAEYEAAGALPVEPPVLEENGLTLFAGGAYAAALSASTGGDKSVVTYLRSHLNRLNQGDYFAALAYVEMSDHNRSLLQAIRHSVRDRKQAATCLGFGPRFLHSTGQAYKGGPNSGVFLQITCDDANDIDVPGQKFTFGVVKSAQARGDFQVLTERGRRAVRVHLGKDVQSGLKALGLVIEQALS
jgi:transaldolase/glucose-6-phosphate isomerase